MKLIESFSFNSGGEYPSPDMMAYPVVHQQMGMWLCPLLRLYLVVALKEEKYD